MLELSTVQNVSQTADSKRRSNQDHASVNSKDKETDFENEYDAVSSKDDDAVSTSEKTDKNKLGEDSSPDAESAGFKAPKVTDDADNEQLLKTSANDAEFDTQTVPTAPGEKQASDLPKLPTTENKPDPALKRQTTTNVEAGGQKSIVLESKRDTPVFPTATKNKAEAAKQPKQTPASVPSPAETAIVSKTLENAAVPQPKAEQKPDVRTADANGQVVRAPASDKGQKPTTEVTALAAATALGEKAAKTDKWAEQSPRRSDAAPIQSSANLAASKKITRQQYMMTAPNLTQTKQLMLPENNDVKTTSVFDLDAGTNWDARSTAQSTSHTLTQTLARAETPTMIGRQMADALQRLPDRPVEISLNPRELGRVRMNISTAEAGITITVLAERPETLDLMRRNIEQLANEFQTLGYESVDFAFSQGEAGQEPDQQSFDKDDAPVTRLDLDAVEDAPLAAPTTVPTTGLDIRV